MRRLTRVSVLLMLATVQGSAGAQPAEQRLHLRALRSGDTIRVSSNFPYHRRSVVVITHIDRDTLRVGGLEGQRLQRGGAIPITSLTRLEVQRGSTGGSHWSRSGASVGLLGGSSSGESWEGSPNAVGIARTRSTRAGMALQRALSSVDSRVDSPVDGWLAAMTDSGTE